MDLRSPALKRGLLLIGSTLSALLLIEGTARVYFAIAPPMSPPFHRWRPGAPPPPPYRDAPYFTDEFVKEFKAIDEGPESFSGTYFNVVDGRRATTDAPASAGRRVWLFGGSTIFCAEVPDRETIASHLQRLLNQQPETYQVSNQGLNALTTLGASEQLLKLHIGPGDVVVFYGGVNGVSRYVYSGGTDNWFVDRLAVAFQRSRHFSEAAQFISTVETATIPAAVGSEAQLSRNVARMVTQYERTILQAAAHVRASGGRLYHFLQPQLFSKRTWSAYERELLRDRSATPAGLDVAFRAGYPPLKDTLNGLSRIRVPNFDLTDAFDDVPPGSEVYFDFCHVNHIANAIVARRIYDAIWAGETSGL
jgi:hypothetical protein